LEPIVLTEAEYWVVKRSGWPIWVEYVYPGFIYVCRITQQGYWDLEDKGLEKCIQRSDELETIRYYIYK
jgi:hypothetical protein